MEYRSCSTGTCWTSSNTAHLLFFYCGRCTVSHGLKEHNTFFPTRIQQHLWNFWFCYNTFFEERRNTVHQHQVLLYCLSSWAEGRQAGRHCGSHLWPKAWDKGNGKRHVWGQPVHMLSQEQACATVRLLPDSETNLSIEKQNHNRLW